jgi:hypothetical protein
MNYAAASTEVAVLKKFEGIGGDRLISLCMAKMSFNTITKQKPLILTGFRFLDQSRPGTK